MTSLAIVIMADRRRAARLDAMIARLGACPVAWADGRTPWETRRAAMEMAPSDATHVLVLQDDVQFVDDLRARAEAMANDHPADVLALYAIHFKPQIDAIRDGWTRTPVVPGQAILFPVDVWRECLAWCDASADAAACGYHDDARIAGWAVSTGRMLLACVPSLVDHDPSAPSLLGHGTHRATFYEGRA